MKLLNAKVHWKVLALLTCGAILRSAHLFSIPFNTPFHLGGLFYEFSHQILLNHFVLPETIPFYSHGGLPFAYPPLGFYLQAVVMKLFAPSLFMPVNLLPPLIAVLTLPAFYWMIKAQTNDNRLRFAALFAFAFMPSAFINQIEAAGLADACGSLAIILYLGGLFRFEKDPRPVPAMLAGFFLGVSVISSPGSAYGGVLISLLFFSKFLVEDLTKHSFKRTTWFLLTGLTGLIISAPYWMTIIRYHEFGGLTTAFRTQQDATALLNQIRYMITFKPADMLTFIGDEGIYGFLFDWLIFAGLIWAVLNKQFFQVLVLFTVWLIPREGSWLAAIPAAWLAASGIVHLFWPMLQRAFTNEDTIHRPPLAPGLLAMIMAMLVVASAINSIHDLQNQPELQISAAAIRTLQQEHQIIPSGTHVLIAGNAALREWSPALLEREVLNCEFGLEWQPEELEQVHLINNALDNHDLNKAMAIVRDYSGDTSIWLAGDPNLVGILVAEADASLDISIQKETPELIFAIIQTRVQSGIDRNARSQTP